MRACTLRVSLVCVRLKKMYAHSLLARRDIFFQISSRKRTSKREEPRARRHHASHRVAPRHGQSGPEWGHGVNRRQRRTYRTFSFFILSLVATRFSFREDHLSSLSLSLLAVKTDRMCDVMMFRLFSLSRALCALLLSHRNHHIVSRGILSRY